MVKPWYMLHLNVPPGGSERGFVQYTPVRLRRLCPPYAYSRWPITTPLWRKAAPKVQRRELIFDGWREEVSKMTEMMEQGGVETDLQVKDRRR